METPARLRQWGVFGGERGSKFARVSENIVLPDKPGYLLLIVGPCRSGTTAFSNVFARAGMPAYMQPIKSMRRAMEDGDGDVIFKMDDVKVAISKETLGIETIGEYFNPVKVLIEAGYPLEKIILLPIMRDPKDTYASQSRMWGQVEAEKLVQAIYLTYKISLEALEMGIKVLPYVHEAIKNNDSNRVIKRLINNIGIEELEYSDHLVDWTLGPKFVKGVKSGEGYAYYDSGNMLEPEIVEYLLGSGVYTIYGEFVKMCEKQLGIKI